MTLLRVPETGRPRVRLERDSGRGATRECVRERVLATLGVSVGGALSVSVGASVVVVVTV